MIFAINAVCSLVLLPWAYAVPADPGWRNWRSARLVWLVSFLGLVGVQALAPLLFPVPAHPVPDNCAAVLEVCRP
jgi:hypothetical protein